ncbi:MAG: asparagine synthase (glutamine-hydrolyzing) [Candidatus Latescibacteria bacterium]|nr:asparagine synthase (glutamine-hydrolyzing) [Candidatus Latescibacterota bacterium]
MCGIAGFFNSTHHSGDTDLLCRMLGSISYRGPDAAGVYIDDYAALGHVRLSIIDLAGGDQPISNEDGTVWITYNGEIYNYPELRKELEKKGHRFSTKTDTEVLVHLYEEEGTEFLQRLNGQWAFALWDTVRRRLFISRDRVGIRPLFYTHSKGHFFFASEIKALFAIPEIERAIDHHALDQIFTLWTTLPESTFFKGIIELPPGHYLIADERGVTTGTYWENPLYPRDEWFSCSPDRMSGELRELLIDAVKIRLRADVPVGTYLSGGLDSSGITAIVAKQFNRDVQTFGIRFSEERFDEGEHQRAMVDFLGVHHREISAGYDAIADSFCRVIYHCEKPVLRTSPAPLYLLASLVRDSGIKVVLTGEGADEFHGGYDIFKEALVRSFWGRCPGSSIRGKLLERLYPDVFRDDRTRKVAASFFGRDIESFNDPCYSHRIRWNNTARIKTFFSEATRAAIGTYDCFQELRETLPAHFDKSHLLQRAQHLEIAMFMSNYLLSSQGDRMGMAHSIEVRMPYLDHRLIEYAGKVPPWFKICGLHEKHLLKKALAPFLPPAVTGRVKHPYRAPIHKSLLALAASAAGKELLDRRMLQEAGMFNGVKVQALLSKLRKTEMASETDSMAIAGILSAQSLWHDFIKKNPGTAALKLTPDRVIDRRSTGE